MNRHGHPLAVANDLNFDSVAHLMLIQDASEVIAIVNLVAVDADDNVAQFDVAIFGLRQPVQSGTGGWAFGSNLHDQESFGNRKLLTIQIGNVATADSKSWPAHGTEAY